MSETISLVAHFELALFQLWCRFLHFLSIFCVLTLGQFLYATPNRWKKSIGLPDVELHAESLEKKIID